MGKKGHLKSALQSQQSRLKVKQKLVDSAQILQVKAKKTHRVQQGQASTSSSGKNGGSNASALSGPMKPKHKAKSALPFAAKPIVPYKSTDKILLVGEGNFSFARALIINSPPELANLPPGNITATAYDKEDECYAKYSDAREIVAELKEKGVKVIFGVDGRRLGKVTGIKGQSWDKIVFNFPHAGKGIADQDRNILSNQLLLLDFLSSAAKLLRSGPIPVAFKSRKPKKTDDDDDESDPDHDENEEDDLMGLETGPTPRGSILVTLRNVVPYTQWDLPRLAKNPPAPQSPSSPPYFRFVLLRSFKFIRSMWEGYEHRMTKGERAHGTATTGEGGEDRTWEFYLSDVRRERD